MASIGRKFVFYEKWYEGTSYNNIGPYDGSRHQRVVYEILLSGLDNNYQRDILTFSTTINIPSTPANGVTIPTTEVFRAYLTSSAPVVNSTDYAIPTNAAGPYDKSANIKDYVGGSIEVTWQINLSELDITSESQSIYIWIYANNSVTDKIYHTYKSTSASASETSKLIISNVTTGDVIASSNIYKPGTSISAKWSSCSAGINNNIDHIRVYYKVGSVPTSSSPGVTISNSVSGTATSINFTLPADSKQGSKIYVAIQAFGKVSGYNGSFKYAQVGSVNNVPNFPSVLESGAVVAGSSTVTFTITKGTDLDTSQSTSLYYKINDGSLQSLNGTTLTISTTTTTSGIKSGTNTIYFYTYDGLEYSSATSKTIEVIYAPVLNSATIEYTKVNNGSNNGATLAKTGVITYNLAQDVSNPTALFQIRTASTQSGLSGPYQPVSLSHSINNSTKKITVDILNSGAIQAGYYFEIQVAIKDNYGTSGYKTLTYGQKPAAAIGVTFKSLSTDGTPLAKIGYFNNKATINFTNPASSTSRPDITSIKIYAGSKEFSSSNIAEGSSPSIELDLSTIARNSTIGFSIVLTDAAGQTATTSINTTLTRTSEIKFEGTEWGVNPTTFKPYTTKTDLELRPTSATATGTDSANITYLYKIKINNIEKALSSKQTSYEVFRDLVNNIIPENARNTSYTGIITVTAVDGFGVSVSLPQKNVIIDYVEAPTFVNSYGVKIKHDFYTGTTNITTSTGTEVASGLAQNHATRLFNPGEGIILMLPKATDYNRDISKYQIYISRNSLPSTSTTPLPATSVTYEEAPWLVLTPNQLTVSDDNYFYYRYKASQYNQNQYYYFKLIVEDSKGNKTEARYSNTYIIGCRVTKPSFSTGAVNVSRNPNSHSVTLDYKNFSIIDLGGSAPTNGWNKGYYEKYSNIDKLTLKIEISPDSSFSTIKTQSIYTTSNLQNFTPLSQSNSSMQFEVPDNWSKIYYRFSVIIDYAKYDEATPVSEISDYFIDVYVGNIPTVSHRSHWVGINSNTPGDDDVFVVENYSGRNKIYLRGTSKTICIDLSAGTINGVEFISNGNLDGAIISGGTW